MRAVTVDAMKLHLEELAHETGARLCEWTRFTRPPETSARLLIRPGHPPQIWLMPLRDRRVYFDGLHEFGHLLTGGMTSRANGLAPVHLVEELNAWLWAVDNARFPPTLHNISEMLGCLATYADDTGAQRDWRDRYGKEGVPVADRLAYGEGIERLARLERGLHAS